MQLKVEFMDLTQILLTLFLRVSDFYKQELQISVKFQINAAQVGGHNNNEEEI